LDKPLESLAAFAAVLMRHLPEKIIGMTTGPEAPLHPDVLALRDDFARAAALIEAGTTAETQAYLSGFLTGVARHAHDTALAEAAENAGTSLIPGRLETLRTMLRRRLDGAETAFGAASSAS
jgi:hypothetical protein